MCWRVQKSIMFLDTYGRSKFSGSRMPSSAATPRTHPEVPPVSNAASMTVSLAKKPENGGMPMIAR